MGLSLEKKQQKSQQNRVAITLFRLMLSDNHLFHGVLGMGLCTDRKGKPFTGQNSARKVRREFNFYFFVANSGTYVYYKR